MSSRLWPSSYQNTICLSRQACGIPSGSKEVQKEERGEKNWATKKKCHYVVRWPLPLGGQIRVQNIKNGGQQRAGGVRREQLLIWLILRLHHTICVISPWICKSESKTSWNTSGFPPNVWLHTILIFQHQRLLSVCFSEWNVKCFSSAAGNLFGYHAAPYWRFKNGPMLWTLPERAIVPGTKKPPSCCFQLLEKAREVCKVEMDRTGVSRTCLLSPSMFGTPQICYCRPCHHWCSFWRAYFKSVGAIEDNQMPEKPDAAPCLFFVSTARSLPVSVLI